MGSATLHGWTVARIEKLAAGIVAKHRAWWTEGTYPDHIEHATAGITLALLTATEPPAEPDLYLAGQKTLRRWIHEESRYRGRRAARKYAMYWTTMPLPGPEEAVTDRLTLTQVLAVLPARQREALLALATHGAYRPAAESMGITKGSLASHLHRARATCLPLLLDEAVSCG